MPGPAVHFSRRREVQRAVAVGPWRLEAGDGREQAAGGGAGDAGFVVSTTGLERDMSPLPASVFLICKGGDDCKD